MNKIKDMYLLRKPRFLLIAVITISVVSCTDVLDPLTRGWVDDDEVWQQIEYTHGVLDMVYENIAEEWIAHLGISADYHTDNAVANNSFSDLATSGGRADSYPLGHWSAIFGDIININYYLENGLETHWTGSDDVTDSIAKARYYGEAHFLRAWCESRLLKQFGGPTDDAGQQFLGYPIIREVYDNDEYKDLPRDSYSDCLDAILSDLDIAYANLPFRQASGASNKYDNENKRGRATQRAVLALKARVLLYAASEAYNPTVDNSKWQAAANAAFQAITEDGGRQNLEAYESFDNTNSADHFWRSDYTEGDDLESAHFPPSRYGNGRCNPSQNLVDAFPDANGFPIDDPNSNYDPNDPYAGRDARFYAFIVYNTDPMFGNQDPVETFIGGKDSNGRVSNEASRTGYYMKRYLSDIAVGIDPRILEGVTTESQKFAVLLDREELYLNFAEAANEAGSDPQTTLGGQDISALDALQAVRARGGSSDYIDSLVTNGLMNKDVFRNLVRNERRIELCFRGHRYWDLRRWKEPIETINEAVKGVSIVMNIDSTFTYSVNDIEQRNYGTNTYYGPVPYDEIAKSQSLVQNIGW